MMRMFKSDVLETFVGFNKTIADDLDLRLVWDCLEVRMEN